VLHPRPWTSCLYPLLCSISPRIRRQLLLRSPLGATVAFGYPSSLSNWGRTCFLDFAQLSDRLDPIQKAGTLAERTRKQPGLPGTQQAEARDALQRACSATLAQKNDLRDVLQM